MICNEITWKFHFYSTNLIQLMYKGINWFVAVFGRFCQFGCFFFYFFLVVPLISFKSWCFKYINKQFTYRASYDVLNLTFKHVCITEYLLMIIIFCSIILIINSSVELNFQKYCTFIRLGLSNWCLYRFNVSVYMYDANLKQS